jgi:(4-(4-[2-(gamma-L-glutamylamino)ethyl]phenoxymethyl)furan-2-yl)methanamine synthase
VTIGWDIGGVNTKVARVEGGDVITVASRAYELQRAPDDLVPLLRELALDIGAVNAPESAFRCAVTMTAELSQMFRTKRDGVTFILDAVDSAFPAAHVEVFAADGRFLSTRAARQQPLDVAAANWAATAHIVAERHPDALLVDIGTTTTDIIPIVNGEVVATGLTDPARLASGELVYTGAVRTPVEAMVTHLPFRGGSASVSAEGFALIGDVHLWTGALSASDYIAPTPDGRPRTRAFAGERIARVICADREMLDEAALSQIADAIVTAQLTQIVSAIRRVIARHPALRKAVVTGIGAFIAQQAARAAGLQVVLLASELGNAAARCAPAAAVALLLEKAVVRA